MDFNLCIQTLLSIFILGGIYTGIAIGLTLIFGTMKLIQFAQGEFSVIGAFAALFCFRVIESYQWNFSSITVISFSIVFSILFCALFGIALYHVVIKRLLNHAKIISLTATLGLAITLRELIGLLWPNGRNPQSFVFDTTKYDTTVFGIVFNIFILSLAAISYLMAFFIYLLLQKTKYGLSAKAIAIDPEAATIIGVPVHRINAVTFMIASIASGISGIIVGFTYGSIRYDMGLNLVIKGFTAAVIGGMDTIVGAAIGGIGLACIESITTLVIPNGSTYRDTISFIILSLLLIIKPRGLFVIGRGEK